MMHRDEKDDGEWRCLMEMQKLDEKLDAKLDEA